jgi:2-polyprenyl-3-methyl-5-hydroxy-6-metoxy-1,4-benzoquinol methylase
VEHANPAARLYGRLQTAYVLAKAKAMTVLGKTDLQYHVFRGIDDRRWLWYNTGSLRKFSTFADVLPTLPDEQTQIRFIGSAGDPALREAFGAYSLVKELAAKYGRPIGADSKILDFGCGWGRTLRFFMKDVRPSNLTGIDVMPLAIELSKKTNPWCNFALTAALPPTRFADNSFDLVYLYSVFSHLSEEAHDLWLTEFHRILKPQGMLIATTWQRDYIERCKRARDGDKRGTHQGSLPAFMDTAAALLQYDRGEYCHSPVGGGDELSTNFYGETCIPEDYVKRIGAAVSIFENLLRMVNSHRM